MEDRLVKTAIRHILVTLAWVGLLLGQRAWAQGPQDWVTPSAKPVGQASQATGPGVSNVPIEGDSSVVGENQPPIGGVFGDTPPGACEFCGGGACLPPTWAVQPSVSVWAMSRANNQRLGAYSLPAGPLPAGNVSVTSSQGITTSNQYVQYLNDAFQETALEVHTPNIGDSAVLGLSFSRFLGRDGEGRDHFLEFAFNGVANFTAQPINATGSIIPFYSTQPIAQVSLPAPAPTALYYQGSLISPFPIYLPNTGQQQELLEPNFSNLGRTYDAAFNRSLFMSETYSTTFNEFELNYRIDGHNQPDQLVMNPNGHWYRECQHGYYWSYFLGMKGMEINETFDYLSSGAQYTSPYTGQAAEFTHQGQYAVHTFNTLLGLQTGGKLEYRFCRWCLDTHGNVGMFMNYAQQDSRITTVFTGTPDANSPALPPGLTSYSNTDIPFSVSHTVVAFAGGFGVSGSYKFLPNLVGHVSYDMLFVGDVARAPDQMVFSSVPETAYTSINTKGSVFYDGVNFGMELDW